MASKIYTAQELRQTAQGLFVRGVVATVPANVQYGSREKEVYADQLKEMLLQGADAMEREERRVKKYQYEVWYTAKDGGARRSTGRAFSLESAKRILSMYKEFSDAHIVRREVGEWEEVKDGE